MHRGVFLGERDVLLTSSAAPSANLCRAQLPSGDFGALSLQFALCKRAVVTTLEPFWVQCTWCCVCAEELHFPAHLAPYGGAS